MPSGTVEVEVTYACATPTLLECEIRDDGTTGAEIKTGHRRPALDSPGGRGLWLAGQLVDELNLRHTLPAWGRTQFADDRQRRRRRPRRRLGPPRKPIA